LRVEVAVVQRHRLTHPLGQDVADALHRREPTHRSSGPIRLPRLIDFAAMEQRQLGRSGQRVSALTLGTMTFGGKGAFANVGDTDVAGAARQLDLCLDAGVTLVDTADVYSDGVSEEIVRASLRGRRNRGVRATEARIPIGGAPNEAGPRRRPPS